MTDDELAEFANQAIAGSFSSQMEALEKSFASAVLTGTSAMRMSVDSKGPITTERRWNVTPRKPSAPLAWGERFEVSPTGKVKKNKRAEGRHRHL